jgi:hypothetical protein
MREFLDPMSLPAPGANAAERLQPQVPAARTGQRPCVLAAMRHTLYAAMDGPRGVCGCA